MDSLTDCIFITSVGLGNESIQVYDSRTGANIKSYRGVLASPRSLNFIGREDYVINAQLNKPLLQIWALNKNDPIEKRLPVPGKVNVLDVNEVGPKHIVMGIKETIYVYNLLHGCPIGVISRHYQHVTSIKFTSCGNYFASAGNDGFVFLWSISSLSESLYKSNRPQVDPFYILGQHSNKVSCLAIAGHGLRSILASASNDSSIKIFDLVTGLLRHNLALNTIPTCMVLNSLGSQLYFGSANGRVTCVKLIPVPQQENIEVKDSGTVCHEGGVTCLSLTSYNNMLITGCDDGDVKVWDVRNYENAKGQSIHSLSFERSVHQGRGKVTNIRCNLFPREVFNTLELESRIMIGEFRNQLKEDVADMVVNIPIKKPDTSISPEILHNSVMTLMKHKVDKNEPADIVKEEVTNNNNQDHHNSQPSKKRRRNSSSVNKKLKK